MQDGSFYYSFIVWLFLVFTCISAVLLTALLDISSADSYVLFMLTTAEDFDTYHTSCMTEVSIVPSSIVPSISLEVYRCCDMRLLFFSAGCAYRLLPPRWHGGIIVLLSLLSAGTESNPRPLRVGSLNCCSATAKMALIHNLINDHNFDILLLSPGSPLTRHSLLYLTLCHQNTVQFMS